MNQPHPHLRIQGNLFLQMPAYTDHLPRAAVGLRQRGALSHSSGAVNSAASLQPLPLGAALPPGL